MSLTVPIEPGPCGFAKGCGHDFARSQPHPREEGGIRKRRQQPGSQEGGRAVALQLRPEARPTTHLRGPQSPAFQPSGG